MVDIVTVTGILGGTHRSDGVKVDTNHESLSFSYLIVVLGHKVA